MTDLYVEKRREIEKYNPSGHYPTKVLWEGGKEDEGGREVSIPEILRRVLPAFREAREGSLGREGGREGGGGGQRGHVGEGGGDGAGREGGREGGGGGGGGGERSGEEEEGARRSSCMLVRGRSR